MENNTAAETKTTWADLMVQAIEKPGLLEQSFSAFRTYSVGNRLYALMQCLQRGITPGPLSTLKQWNAKGRRVRKGERALRLLMPIEVGKSCACAKCAPEAPKEEACRL